MTLKVRTFGTDPSRIGTPEATSFLGETRGEPRRMPYKSRWTPEDKIRIVLESLNTNISMSELCRKYNLTPGTFYQWREKFVQGGKLALSGALKDPAKEKDAENERLKKLIGELTIANDSFKKVLEWRRK
jgi:transposase